MKKPLKIVQLLELLDKLEKKINISFKTDPGVTLTQFKALNIIENSPLIKPSLLSKKLGITRASTSSIIKDLEKAELIEQIKDPEDKRSSQLKNTDYGTSRLEVCRQNLEYIDKKFFSKKSQSIEELIKLL